MRRRAGTMTRADRGEPPGVDVHVDRPGTLCSYILLELVRIRIIQEYNE